MFCVFLQLPMPDPHINPESFILYEDDELFSTFRSIEEHSDEQSDDEATDDETDDDTINDSSESSDSSDPSDPPVSEKILYYHLHYHEPFAYKIIYMLGIQGFQ